VDKLRPDADASEQDESREAGGELVISGGDAALLLERLTRNDLAMEIHVFSIF
jgi:hypothetical protein